MRKILLILVIFLSLPSFAIRAVTQEEHIAFLKKIGLNETQIEKLEKADAKKYEKISKVTTLSRQYRRENPTISKEEYNEYLRKLIKDIEKDYEKELSTFLNKKQKQIYIERSSLVF